MDLVACVSEPESTWSHVQKLIEKGEWENVFIITNEQGKVFSTSKEVEFVLVDFTQPATEVIPLIQQSLRGRIKDLEVALNMVSGSGKEHMSILSALLKLGLGIRLVALTKEGVTEL